MSRARSSFARNFTINCAIALALPPTAVGCFGAPTPQPTPEEPGPTVTPPPPEPPPPAPAVYVRGSLQPLYQLTPRTEYGRFNLSGVTLRDADFTSTAGTFVTAAQKLDEIGAQIARERGLPTSTSSASTAAARPTSRSAATS